MEAARKAEQQAKADAVKAEKARVKAAFEARKKSEAELEQCLANPSCKAILDKKLAQKGK